MTLAPGTRLGPYEIVGPLGAGGMGEVYRARDTRLGRDVAIKVLPQHLSANSEVRARFEREAKTVSSLNHPNICTLFDVGREGDTDYLVMELVEGETLSQRLTKGALPPADVLRLGAQIADALDRAHRAGVIHRDLKPGNVMLTKSGAKLMDFGLARASVGGGPVSGSGATMAALTQSPTVISPLTAEGTIVGTFQYMSPEQLEGREADARSDLWALGCVLYEMATGRRAFDGRSQASLISAIMSGEPTPVSQVADAGSISALDRLIRSCLAKDPDERVQSAHDVRLQLRSLAESGAPAVPSQTAGPRGTGRERIAWGVAAVLGLIAVLALIWWPHTAGGPEKSVRLALLPPENVLIDDESMNTVVSPDGGSVVFRGTDTTGTSQLWVRDLDATAARALAGTDAAMLPFWSPDSRFIGFFADGKLRKIDVAGRNVQILCDAPDGRGAAWSPRGVIVFAPASAGPLFRVPEGGGTIVAATVVDTARGDFAHRFPSFLPDGRSFLFTVLAKADTVVTCMGSLDSKVTRPLVAADNGAFYAAPGFVLFSRNEALLAQRFDARSGRLIGEPQGLGTDPADASRFGGRPPASVSSNGVLVQRRRAPRITRLAWLDREGRRIASVSTPAAHYTSVTLSPDGERAALIRGEGNIQDVWEVELRSGIATRVTASRTFAESPIWSPDSRSLWFAMPEGNNRYLFRRTASGVSEIERMVRLPGGFDYPSAWSPDGRLLLVRSLSPVTGEDVWVYPQGGGAPRPLLHDRFHEEDPSVSPDGRWIAYRSDESGRSELYVQSFPEPGGKLRVSKDGAGQGARSRFGRPYWRRDGRELIFVSGDGITVMSVAVEPGATFKAGSPRALYRIPPGCSDLAASVDGGRFLILEDVSTSESAAIQVMLHWPAEIGTR